ncbi:MAG: SO_0444 family Cu/Zn efflux transporter [Candidatus Auribacterota bacterium]|jgi:uncharacterized membrane protein YraQ (UPF0718 family)|nr:SO_0444 family Cu/Zn efflux transporter [Candidatus Auribacterota bacterium]
MDIIVGIFKESYMLLNKMSVFLLFGFLFAGVLHIFMKEGVIAKHLGTKSLSSVIKASLFGIPLPLCSCGVVPAALSIRKDGASKGAVLSFLISTPVTGVDSIFASYALLGWFFTAYRVFAAFVTAVFAGIVSNILSKEKTPRINQSKKTDCKTCCGHSNNGEDHKHTLAEKIKKVFTYAFGDLIGDIGWWLLLGIVIGGAISYFVPASFVERYLGSPVMSMLIMILVGIPMYVCDIGSLPIVMALMMKGMNPGAGFVFLVTGPATNSVALTLIAKELGLKTAVIFVGSVIVCSFGLGLAFDKIWNLMDYNAVFETMHHQSQILPAWLEIFASSVIIIAVAYNFFLKKMSGKHIHAIARND